MNQIRRSGWRLFLVGFAVIGIILFSATGRKVIAAPAVETSPTKVTVGSMEKIYSIYFEEGGGRIITRCAEIDMEGLRIYGEKLKELELLKRDPDIQRWIDLNYLKAGGR